MVNVRSTCLLLTLIFCLVLAAACNPAAPPEQGAGSASEVQGPVDPSELSGTLDVWGFGTEDPVGEVRVKAFEKAFPNVEVKLTPGDFDEQKFLSAVAAGNPPDVVHIDRGLVGSYAARGALVALDDYVTASELDLGVYLPAALEQVQLDGATYGLPEFNNVIVAYLNNGALEEAGLSPEAVKFGDWQTMAQINADLAKMSGGDPARVGFDPRMPDMLPLWAEANGGALVSEDGTESLLDTPEVVETVAFAAELLDPVGGQQKYQAFSESLDIFGEQNPLVADQVGITLFEQWYLGVLGEVSPDVDITVVPFATHDSGEPVSFAGGLSLAVPRDSDNARAAFEFAKFMTDEDTWFQAAQVDKRTDERAGSIYIGTYTGNQRADERIRAELIEPTGNEAFDQAIEVINQVQADAISVPANAAGSEVKSAWEDGVREALLGRTSPEEAMQKADEAAQQALDSAQAQG